MTGLMDRVALVVGAGGGIGQATVARLAQEGAEVIAADLDADLAEKARRTVVTLGRKGLALEVDVARCADIERMVQQAVEAMGRIDIFMNFAAVLRIQNVLDIREADWNFVCDVSLKGAFFAMQAAARCMVGQGNGGKIVNIASLSGKWPEPYMLHYAVSKAGVISMTKSAAVALGPHRINVNAVCPGPTMTEMSLSVTRAMAERNQLSLEEMIRRREATIPTGRRNRPEDVAAMAVFLASADADNITGQAYNVDGGLLTTA